MCSPISLEVLKLKVKIINPLCFKLINSSKYAGFSNHFTVRCSAKFNKLGNADLGNSNFALAGADGPLNPLVVSPIDTTSHYLSQVKMASLFTLRGPW